MGDYIRERMINTDFTWLFIILIQFVVILLMVAPVGEIDKLIGFIAFQFLILFILLSQNQQIKRVIKMAE